MLLQRFHGAGDWIKQHHTRLMVIGIGGFLLLVMIIQVRYPSELLLPFTTVDNIDLGVQSKTSAILRLDTKYREASVGLYFGSADTAYRSLKPADIGTRVTNDDRIKNMDYPWYLRLAPGSILWGHFVIQPNEPIYQHDDAVMIEYVTKEFGETCSIIPLNANIKIVNGELQTTKSAAGGTCKTDDLIRTLNSIKLSIVDDVKVTLPIEEIAADVDDASAKALAATITSGIAGGISVVTGQDVVLIPRATLVDWLEFAITDGKLDYTFNIDRSSTYLNEQFAAKVALPAGVTTINTYNFAEISRITGPSGQTLDSAGTLARLKAFVDGSVATVTPATAVVPPSVQYTRSYSNDNEGLSALMKNFATSHPGRYGVALSELSGQYRRATYNATESFITASTYKLYVAYSTLLRIENGSWRWTDQISGGRDLTKCFDDMIVLSDNACAVALIEKIGSKSLTNEARAIGCVNTSFLGANGLTTTAGDLALLLAQLQTGQILNQQTNRDMLIGAMKRNIYRQGIPRGINAPVANKVGFLDGVLHDAAIVYASTGPYVLVITTDGSSWAHIAELTRQIEALRIQ